MLHVTNELLHLRGWIISNDQDLLDFWYLDTSLDVVLNDWATGHWEQWLWYIQGQRAESGAYQNIIISSHNKKHLLKQFTLLGSPDKNDGFVHNKFCNI